MLPRCHPARTAILCLLVAACASTPQASPERDAEARRFETHPGAATLYVYRSPFNTATDDNVLYVDGRLIGSTLPGGYFRVNLPPGRHTLHGTGPDGGKLTFDVRPGTLYFVDLSVVAGNSHFQPVPESRGRRELASCCMLLENWAPGQRPLLR
jgi:hypothetical protein